MQGQLLGIFIARARSAEMTSIEEARVCVDRGIEGDRYFQEGGTFSKGKKYSRDITLIEIETVIALKRDYQIEVQPIHLRRNLLVRGIALNHFVDRFLGIGDVVVRGVELCEPCGYLSKMLNLPLKEALKHRGGLRCRVVSGGNIVLGQTVEPTEQ